MNTTMLIAPTDRPCDSCNAPITRGNQAAWNPDTGVIECVDCTEPAVAPSIIVASVARSRDGRSAVEQGDSRATDMQFDVEPDDEEDDDATPVNGIPRPPLPLEAPDVASASPDDLAPPNALLPEPSSWAPDGEIEQIQPLVPPSHEPSVEQAAPIVDAPVPPPPPPMHTTSAGAADGELQGSFARQPPHLVPKEHTLPDVPSIASAPVAAAPAPPVAPAPALPTLPSESGHAQKTDASTAVDDAFRRPQGGSVTMRNRKIARSRMTIGRLVIASTGIWVVDDRDDTGKVVLVSDRRSSEPKVHIAGKDRTKILRKADVAAQAVLARLAEIDAAQVPVRRVFCFSQAILIGTTGERIVGGVALLSRMEFEEAVTATGSLNGETIAQLADHLGSSFPAA